MAPDKPRLVLDNGAGDTGEENGTPENHCWGQAGGSSLRKGSSPLSLAEGLL